MLGLAALILLSADSARALNRPDYDVDLNPPASEPPPQGNEMGWREDDEFWELSLPFEFPLYDRTHSTAYVGSNGYLTMWNIVLNQINEAPDVSRKLPLDSPNM